MSETHFNPQNRPLIREVVDAALRAFNGYGIRIKSKAQTTESYYLEFRNSKLGTLRISDHPPADYALFDNVWHVRLFAEDRIRRRGDAWCCVASYKNHQTFFNYMKKILPLMANR